MCARVGNQRNHSVVTAGVRTDAVRSNRLTPYLLEDRESSYYQAAPHLHTEDNKSKD
jgi:hypothetical protein